MAAGAFLSNNAGHLLLWLLNYACTSYTCTHPDSAKFGSKMLLIKGPNMAHIWNIYAHCWVCTPRSADYNFLNLDTTQLGLDK